MRVNVVRVRFGVVAVAAAMMAAGCGSSSSPTTPSPTPSGPTFSQQVQAQILTPACVSCHTDEGRVPAANLNLRPGAAYPNMVGVTSWINGKAGAIRVIAGNPSGSYLVQKLEGTTGIVGAQMPRNAAPLSTAQIALIRQWIQNGAPNN